MPQVYIPEGKPPKPLRWQVALLALALAAVLGWVLFSTNEVPAPDADPHELSRADGRSRFWPTRYSVAVLPANSSFRVRLVAAWMQFRQRHSRKNPTSWSFPATPVRPCAIDGLLNQCMEITGTQYLIAVEIAGGVRFGHTNVLNGAQWVAAFENAVQNSQSVLCYDYATKHNFEDTLLLIREKPGIVKVVPRTKLADYQKAGLVNPRFKPEL